MEFNFDTARSFAKRGCKLCNGKGFLEFVRNHHRKLSDKLLNANDFEHRYCYKSGCSLSKLEKLKKLHEPHV